MNEYQPLFFDEPEEEAAQPDGPVPGPAATVVFSEAPGGPFDYLVPPELQEPEMTKPRTSPGRTP